MFLSFRKYDFGCSSRIRILITHPGSRGQKGTDPGSRIRNTGFTVLVLNRNYICFLATTKRVFFCCFGQGVVYLSEIQTVEDLKELSAKQAKEILAMNR
jgi:hypothetical protein